MSALRTLQKEFMQYLLQQDSSIHDNISKQGVVKRSKRLAIYGNAYKLRLKECIENDHEILGFYLGDDLFDEMTEGYIHSRPSYFTSLRDFCQYLPAYLNETEPFSNTPIISEIAAFEQYLLSVFDAADAECTTLEDLSNLEQDLWPDMKLRFHPGMQIFNTNWNAVQSWQALKANKTPPIPKNESASWLIWRNHERVTEFRSLPIEEHAMLATFLHGKNFAQVCEKLLTYCEEETVANTAIQYLSGWLKLGIVSRLL